MKSPFADRFFDVPRSPHATSAGPVELPILYRDVRNVVTVFGVSAERARAVLAGTGLEPVAAGAGRALAAMAFYEYRDTTVGVYNEVGTAIFVVRAGEPAGALGLLDLLMPPRARRVGMYVVDLPVTTALACAAGRELWGYPKFVTRIEVGRTGRDVAFAVQDPDGPDDGGEICRLAGRFGPGVPAPPLSLVTYTQRAGKLVRTHVDVRGCVMLRSAGTVALRIGGSRHAMAERLRALGLDGARPLAALVTDRFQSLLHAGEVAA